MTEKNSFNPEWEEFNFVNCFSSLQELFSTKVFLSKSINIPEWYSCDFKSFVNAFQINSKEFSSENSLKHFFKEFFRSNFEKLFLTFSDEDHFYTALKNESFNFIVNDDCKFSFTNFFNLLLSKSQRKMITPKILARPYEFLFYFNLCIYHSLEESDSKDLIEKGDVLWEHIENLSWYLDDIYENKGPVNFVPKQKTPFGNLPMNFDMVKDMASTLGLNLQGESGSSLDQLSSSFNLIQELMAKKCQEMDINNIVKPSVENDPSSQPQINFQAISETVSSVLTDQRFQKNIQQCLGAGSDIFKSNCDKLQSPEMQNNLLQVANMASSAMGASNNLTITEK